MDRERLRALQAPLKDRYRERAETALVTLKAEGALGSDVICHVATAAGKVPAGLHPAAGGDGTAVCSGDMLLQALAGCAGVTLLAVATSMGLTIRGGSVRVEGEIDFRGTLGVARDAPVGFKAVRLVFALDTDADPAQCSKLIELTERYCVVYQTLKRGVEMTSTLQAASS